MKTAWRFPVSPVLSTEISILIIRTEQTVMTDSKDDHTDDWKDRTTLEYIELIPPQPEAYHIDGFLEVEESCVSA